MPQLKPILEANGFSDKEIRFALSVTQKIFETNIRQHKGMTTEAILKQFREDSISYHETFLENTLKKMEQIKDPFPIIINVGGQWYNPNTLS